MPQIIPVHAIIPTANRADVLKRTIESVALQDIQPEQIILVDASEGDETSRMSRETFDSLQSKIVYHKAIKKGAATQRNQGVETSLAEYIMFMDDDILLEKDAIGLLWNCIQSNAVIGGVCAMITNQRYHTPGTMTRIMYRLMHGKKLKTYAGKCIGPAWNLLPEDNEQLPDINPVEWMNLGLVIYRKAALPNPVFRSHFTGYSMMEDLTLSLEVAEKWKLCNVRTARIFHDSQSTLQRKSVFNWSKMELVNRQYIMHHILGRRGFSNYFKLYLLESWGIITSLTNANGWKNLLPNLLGKFAAIKTILFPNQRK